MTTYSIVLEGDDTGGWCGLVPDLPGLLLMGDTRTELLARAPEIIADHIDALRSHGLPVPAQGELIAQVDVPA